MTVLTVLTMYFTDVILDHANLTCEPDNLCDIVKNVYDLFSIANNRDRLQRLLSMADRIWTFATLSTLGDP